MQRAGESLWAVLRRLPRPKNTAEWLAAVWPVVVGQRLAAHTRPLAFAEGVLEVGVGESEWQAQLEGMTGELRAQVNTWWGCALVREVRFVPGKAGASSLRRSLSARNHARHSKGKARAESEAAAAELEPSLSKIADKDLRELIARVAARYLASEGST